MIAPERLHRLRLALARGFAGLLLAGAGPSVASPAIDLALPSAASQGQLLQGRAPAGAHLRVDGQSPRISPEGWFLIGVGRDRRAPIEIEISLPGQPPQRQQIAVQTHDWPVEQVDGVPPKTVAPPPEIAQRIAEEQARVAAARRRDDPRSDFAAGLHWPLRGRISGQFGAQRSYNGSPGSAHSGTDIAAATGTPVRAPAAGVISFADPDLYLTGGTLLLDHGHGLSSVFLHLSRIEVKLGQRVEQGQVIAAVGATGRASGPHLHWGLNLFELRLDPLQALSHSQDSP